MVDSAQKNCQLGASNDSYSSDVDLSLSNDDHSIVSPVGLCEHHYSSVKQLQHESLTRIFEISGILDQLVKTDENMQEIVSFLVEQNSALKPQFDSLKPSKIREVVDNLKIEVYEQGS